MNEGTLSFDQDRLDEYELVWTRFLANTGWRSGEFEAVDEALGASMTPEQRALLRMGMLVGSATQLRTRAEVEEGKLARAELTEFLDGLTRR